MIFLKIQNDYFRKFTTYLSQYFSIVWKKNFHSTGRFDIIITGTVCTLNNYLIEKLLELVNTHAYIFYMNASARNLAFRYYYPMSLINGIFLGILLYYTNNPTRPDKRSIKKVGLSLNQLHDVYAFIIHPPRRVQLANPPVQVLEV